jgi:hypothetical protein
MKHYKLSDCERFINEYLELGGTTTAIEEGSLGLGVVVCKADGYKTAIIQEIYLNEWSSTHTVRLYNKTPKKYLNF